MEPNFQLERKQENTKKGMDQKFSAYMMKFPKELNLLETS